jgi:Ser-tRNA(Ala) deacylase AlaX
MNTVKKYLNDPQTKGVVQISEVIQGEKPIVRLAETWFHPQGGGQKADRGKIGNAHVVHVAHNGGVVDHFVDSVADLREGQSVEFEIDVEWRRLNAVYHTAGHLIAGVVEAAFPGYSALAGHQWPGEARVEFAIPQGPGAAVDGAVVDGAVVEERVRAELAKRVAVSVAGDPFHAREIVIGELKGIPCGGTHVHSLGEIAQIRVTGVKKKGDRLRVSYEAVPA